MTISQTLGILGLVLEWVSVLWVIKELLFYNYEKWYQWFINGKMKTLRQSHQKKKEDAHKILILLTIGVALQGVALLV